MQDTLLVQQDNGLKLPAWAEHIGLDKMLKLRERSHAVDTETPFMKRIGAGPLVTEIVDKLTQKENGTISQSLQIYSAHDSNMINLMSALNMSSQFGYFIDFAAAIVFELYRIDGNSIVKVIDF